MARSPEAGAAAAVARAGDPPQNLAAGQTRSAALLGRDKLYRVDLPWGRVMRLPRFEALFLVELASGHAVDKRLLIEKLQRYGRRANRLNDLVQGLMTLGLSFHHSVSYCLIGDAGRLEWSDKIVLPNGSRADTTSANGIVLRELALSGGRAVSLSVIQESLIKDNVNPVQAWPAVAYLRNAGVRISSIRTIALAPEWLN